MGLTQSSVEETTITLPRIEDADTFHDRFRDLLRTFCLSNRERDWLRVVFDKWGFRSDSGTLVWTKTELADFIGDVFPDALQETIHGASPLLLRCMSKLGTFPWHNAASVSTDVIEFEQLQVAIIILLRRFERNIAALHFPVVEDPAGRGDETPMLDQWLHRLFFQCMAKTDPKAADDEASPQERSQGDDYHLIQAHSLVSACNKERIRAKQMIKGALIIPVTDLPSSLSQAYAGHIPGEEFKALLKILLASNLYLHGQAPETLCANMDELDRITDNLFGAFLETPEAQQQVLWGKFQHVLDSHAPYLFAGLTRVLSSFILDKDLSHEVIRHMAKSDAAARRRRSFSQLPESLSIQTGSILNAHTLAQLATFLPPALPLLTASIRYSLTANDLGETLVGQVLRSGLHPILLLISGTASPSGDNVNRPSPVECTFGAFTSNSRDRRTIVFQLSPSQWAASSRKGSLVPVGNEGDSADIIQCRIGAQSDIDSVVLTLDLKKASAHFNVSGTKWEPITLSGFQVRTVEVVSFGGSYPWDLTFDVSPRPDFSAR